MGVLSDKDIRKLLNDGKLVITDFSEECLQPASYDLRLGKHAYVSHKEQPFTLSEGGFLTLESGAFALVCTHETIEMPLNLRGRVGLRARYSLTGLINLSGPQIDPGFRGRLTLGIVNLGPRTRQIKYLDRVFTVEFDQLVSTATKGYSGEFKQSDALPPHIVEIISHGISSSLPQISMRLERVESKMDNLQRLLYVVTIPLVLALIALIIAVIQVLLK